MALEGRTSPETAGITVWIRFPASPVRCREPIAKNARRAQSATPRVLAGSTGTILSSLVLTSATWARSGFDDFSSRRQLTLDPEAAFEGYRSWAIWATSHRTSANGRSLVDGTDTDRALVDSADAYYGDVIEDAQNPVLQQDAPCGSPRITRSSSSMNLTGTGRTPGRFAQTSP